MRRIVVCVVLVFLSLCAFAQSRGFDPHKQEGLLSFDYKLGKNTFCVTLEINDTLIVAQTYQLKGKRWKYFGPQTSCLQIQEGEMSFPDTVSMITLENGKNYIKYSYLHDMGFEKVYTLGLYDVTDMVFHSLCFQGNNIKPKADQAFCIEGLSSYGLCEPSYEIDYLHSLIKSDSRLKEISEADLRSDSDIKWWLSSNPKAFSNAKTVEFGCIGVESSINTAFKAAKKATKGRLQAAVVDVRGYSCVVVYNSKTSSHLLVWVEAECKNKKTDRYLSQVYFQDANTLVMCYYKGKAYFKYRINLATRTLIK